MNYLHDLVLLLVLFEQPVAHAPGLFLAVPMVNIMPSYKACPQTEEILHQIRRNICSVTLVLKRAFLLLCS